MDYIMSNSMKLWAMLCRATQDGQVMVESSDKMWSTGDGNGKPLQYSCLENPMNSMKRQKDRTLKDELPRPVGAQYATGEEWRNSSRKNEEMEPKWKQRPVVDVTGDESKVWCCHSPSEDRQTENHNHRKLTNLITWTTALSNSMKLWAIPCRATQDGRVMVKSSDKMWSTGEGNGKTLQYSCFENPVNSMKR